MSMFLVSYILKIYAAQRHWIINQTTSKLEEEEEEEKYRDDL